MATGIINMPTLMPKRDRIYLFRLQKLIKDGGLLVLRNILDQTLVANELTLTACLNHGTEKITRLKNRGIITQAQYDIMYPADGNVPSTLDMDGTLIMCLLRNIKCFGLNAKFDWSITPAGTDFSVEADILRLEKYRNNICHISTTTGIQHKMFTTWLKDIEHILIRLDSSVQKPVQKIQQVIDEYKKSHIDTETGKRIQKEIKRWNDIEANTNIPKEEICEIRKDVGEISDDPRRIQEETTGVKTSRNIVQSFPTRRYQETKKDLKDNLIKFYKMRHSKVQLSPLFEENGTPLATFYVRPEIYEKKLGTCEMQQIDSLLGMFRSGYDFNKELYLTADAGIGKTTFSKYLALSWCQAHYPEEKNKTYFEKDDIDCMRTFVFVFLVLLRESYNLCSIDDLIFELVITKLAHSEKFNKRFLQDILDRERCLVILDGLDEWTHPESSWKPCNRRPQSTPHRNEKEMCTVLTTTRPWKFEVLNLGSHDLGKVVELRELSRFSSFTLTFRAIETLKSLSVNGLVFKRSVSEIYCKVGDMKLSLLSGLMTESTTETLTERVSEESFSNETVQEFIAYTFLISQKFGGQRLALEKCKSVESILNMSTFCHLISKMNASMMCEISEGFASVINKDERALEYRNRTCRENIKENQLYHIQNMLLSCLKGMHEGENIQICLQDVFISGQSKRDLQCLSKLNKKMIKSLYIDTVETSLSLRESAILSVMKPFSTQSSLRKIFGLSSLINLNDLQKLYYEGNMREEAEINLLLSPCLHILSLSVGTWKHSEGNLSENLAQIQNLQYLYIYEFSFSHEILEIVFDFISSKSTLKKVGLYKLYCYEHGLSCARRKLDLSKNYQLAMVELSELPPLEINITSPSLIKVKLSRIDLGENSLLLSPEMLKIEDIELEFIEMSAERIQNNVNVLVKIPHSVSVLMYWYHKEPEPDLEPFRKYIQSSENFDVTDNYYYYKEHGKWRFGFNTRKAN